MVTVIADDLTGACDTGAAFAQRGFRTLVRITLQAGNRHSDDQPSGGMPDVLVLNTESRYLPHADAVAAVRAAGMLLLPLKVGAIVYKKIDSTLRGHPGDELHALLDAMQLDTALVTPAFPAQGRTVVNGQLMVHGQPLELTLFAHEGAHGRLAEVFAHSSRPVHMLTSDEVRHDLCRRADSLRSLPGQGQTLPRPLPSDRLAYDSGIIIADAQTDTDLELLVRWALARGVRLLCGSAGLATALASQLQAPGNSHAVLTGPTGPVLIIAGSLHPSTVGQVQYVHGRGVPVIQPTADWLSGDAGVTATLADEITTKLQRMGCAVLTTSGLAESPLGRLAVARQLSAIAVKVASRMAFGRLVLTGGDVATAVCTALGAHWLLLTGEAQPGIAIGELADGRYAGLQVITKAGGFGAEDALMRQIGINPMLH